MQASVSLRSECPNWCSSRTVCVLFQLVEHYGRIGLDTNSRCSPAALAVAQPDLAGNASKAPKRK